MICGLKPIIDSFFSVAEMTGSGIGRQWQIGAAAC
jgi:hypothetical protein